MKHPVRFGGRVFFFEQPWWFRDTLRAVSSVLQVRPWAQAPTPEGGDSHAFEEARLVAGLQAGEPWARAALVDRYGVHVRRVLVRVLGARDNDVDDLAQETMLAALQGVKQLQATSALKGWLTSIAVFSARGAIRKRQRWRWLRKDVDTDLVAAPAASADVMEAARSVYKIMEQMPVDERIPFALRMFEGMELQELVHACDMSMATLRRRLASAQARFDKLAAQSEALRPWVKGKVRGDE